MVNRERLIILFLSVLTLWLWWPRVQQGLPYFYEEDEAHHFNRTVEMVKTGDLNPRYFHKPSLHFYLRIPAIIVSFLNEVREGRAQKVDDIVTRDSAGIGGYAFSTSHPGIVKGARMVSVACGVVAILCVYAILSCLTGSLLWSFYGALLTLGAQLLFQYGAEVGVDIVTAACVLVCCAVAVWGQSSSYFQISSFISGVFAGLAIGAKYNSAPVLAVPFCGLISRRFSSWAETLVNTTALSFLVMLGFFCSTPYAISSLPLFVNQVAYEVWHYGIAGHEGHTSEPGLPHLMHYIEDLSFVHFGCGPVILGVLGLLCLSWKREFPVVLFPIIYVWYMSDQRAHFIRNMVVVVPFLGIGAAYVLSELSIAGQGGRLKYIVFAIAGLLVVEPYYHLFTSRMMAKNAPESRILAAEWLRSVEVEKGLRIALDRTLQFDPHLRLDSPGRVVDLQKVTPEEVYLNGFDGVLLGAEHRASAPSLAEEWPGVSEPQRIVANPWIGAYLFGSQWVRDHESGLSGGGQVLPMVGSGEWRELPGGEKWLWIQKRRARLPITPAGSPVMISVEVMTPWPGQTMTINNQECAFETAGQWKVCRVLSDVPELQIAISRVGSIAGSGDPRVLGVAIREPRFE